MAANPLATPQRTLTIDTVRAADGEVTLVCRGRITIETAGAFKSQVKSLAPGQQHLLADLGDVDYVDSSGLGDVLAAYLSARSVGCELKLIKVHPRVRDLLNITRLMSVFEAGVPS